MERRFRTVAGNVDAQFLVSYTNQETGTSNKKQGSRANDGLFLWHRGYADDIPYEECP